MAYVFFDVDGTLTDRNHVLKPSAVRSIRALRRKGHKAFLNTGMAKGAIRKDVLDIGFDGIVAVNGASIYFGDTVWRETLIPVARLEPVLKEIEKHRVAAWLEGPHGVYVADLEASPATGDFVRFMRGAGVFVKTWRDMDFPINKLTVYTQKTRDLNRIKARLSPMLTVVHRRGILEVQNGYHNKAEGMSTALEKMGIAQKVYAFGDSENDAEMLSAADIGIAVESAEDAAKAVADHICAAPENDGIAQALRHFDLISEDDLKEALN